MLNQQQKLGAIYCRLSRDDGGDAESNSISNQREMLLQYAKDKGIIIKSEYIDDGVSGVTFNRSGFNQMIEDMEAGKFGVLLCKDLSRLGRNNALVAYYTEIVFQDYGVRFICVNDGFDSEIGDNEIMGFKSVINEFYARDISKKIRSSFKTMAIKGQFRGSNPPYGYMKNPEDRHRFIPNPETAPIIKEIFAMAAEGVKPYQISLHLSGKEILTPLRYLAHTTGKYKGCTDENFPTDWHVTTILGILKNRQYCGHLVSQKQTTQSFKNKKAIYRPESEWIICENTHQALVDEQTFDKVQKLVRTKRRENKSHVENIFAGLLKCPDCGYKLSYNSPQSGAKTGCYVCNLYKSYSRLNNCTSHYISHRLLYLLVLDRIQKVSEFVKAYQNDYETFYKEYLQQGSELNSRSQRQELERYQKRVRELDAILKKIVEQNALGALTDERFASLSAEYEAEQRDLNEKIARSQDLMNLKRDGLQNAEHFLNAIGKYTNVTELTVSLLNEVIDRIEVHTAEGKGKARTQAIDVYWRFIGLLPE